MNVRDQTVEIERAFLIQKQLDNFVDSILFETQISPDLVINTVKGSELVRYSDFKEKQNREQFLISYNYSQSQSSTKNYDEAFENNMADIDTIAIRCIDERRNSCGSCLNQLSFATAGNGCCSENSEEMSINETARECLEIVRHWRKFNQSTDLLTIQIEPHESCGASYIALSKILNTCDIDESLVNEYSISFATKLSNRIGELIKECDISKGLKIVVVTLPIADVFPKNIHIATSALICRLDISKNSTQQTYTNFHKFNKHLGDNNSALNTFVISGEDLADDFHHIINTIGIASLIATSDHGICNNSYLGFSKAEQNIFSIYIEFNGKSDYLYLNKVINVLNENFSQKGLKDHVQIIAIDKVS
jgi:hypothetical protein